jgi:hypothetical protein
MNYGAAKTEDAASRKVFDPTRNKYDISLVRFYMTTVEQ